MKAKESWSNGFETLISPIVNIGIMAGITHMVGLQLEKIGLFGDEKMDIKEVMEGIMRGVLGEFQVQMELKDNEINRLKKEVESLRDQKTELSDDNNVMKELIANQKSQIEKLTKKKK